MLSTLKIQNFDSLQKRLEYYSLKMEAFKKACINLLSIYIKVIQVNEMSCAFIIKDFFKKPQDYELPLKEWK